MIEIIDPSHFIGTNLARTMRRGIKSQAPEMMVAENDRVRSRTPDATGALRADEIGTYNTNPDDDEIIHLYTTADNQIAAYGKQYAVFVEGPMLGDNGMWSNSLWAQGYNGAHMYEDAHTDEDANLFEEYGMAGLSAGWDLVTAGAGDGI